MTDSEKIAAPAEQPVASESPCPLPSDAVETPSEPAPKKKPALRRVKPAVDSHAELRLENAGATREEQSVSAPPAPA